MTTRHLIAYCTCPNLDVENGLAERMVIEDLAACVNIVSRISPGLLWQGRAERPDEQLPLIETAAARYPVLEQALCKARPYEVPEIVRDPSTHGPPKCLQ